MRNVWILVLKTLYLCSPEPENYSWIATINKSFNLCHGPPQSGMGVPGMRVLEARWVRIRWWQTETNTEAVWIWVYFAALKQGILYIKKPNITSLRNYIQWNNHKYQQKSFGTVKHKNHPSITTLKLCIQWITNRTGNIIINHQNITILKGCIQWGLSSKASGIFPGAG